MNAWDTFKRLSLAAQIYVVLFVAIMFSGATVVYSYVPEIMLVMIVILCLMSAKKSPRQSGLITMHG